MEHKGNNIKSGRRSGKSGGGLKRGASAKRIGEIEALAVRWRRLTLECDPPRRKQLLLPSGRRNRTLIIELEADSRLMESRMRFHRRRSDSRVRSAQTGALLANVRPEKSHSNH